jgi:hypothetical protein
MRPETGKNSNGTKKIINHLAAEKKKTLLAICLVILMAFMWVRVFFRKTTEVEGAVIAGQTDNKKDSKPALKISYVELPEVEGRNDVITRNFFNSNGWKSFNGQEKNVVSIEEVNVVPGDVMEKVIKKVVQKLKLEAIWIGENPRAYINDKVHSVGDTLLVSDGADKYECEVVAIEDNTVVIRCGNAEVKLKLTKDIENSG